MNGLPGFDPLANLLNSNVNVSPQVGSNPGLGLGALSSLGNGFQPQQPQVNAPNLGGGLSGFERLGQASNIGQSLLSGYLGLQSLGLAKDQLKFDKSTFATNHANQVTTTNSALEDRQRARVAANPNSESVASYLSRNRVS